MRELDQAMLAWLDHRYELATVAERDAFAALLELQDPEIVELLDGRRHVARFDPIIEHMKATLAAAAGTDQAVRH